MFFSEDVLTFVFLPQNPIYQKFHRKIKCSWKLNGLITHSIIILYNLNYLTTIIRKTIKSNQYTDGICLRQTPSGPLMETFMFYKSFTCDRSYFTLRFNEIPALYSVFYRQIPYEFQRKTSIWVNRKYSGQNTRKKQGSIKIFLK